MTPEQFEDAAKKLAAIGNLSGVGQTSNAVAPRQGVKANQNVIGDGPIKPIMPKNKAPQPAQSVAQTVFGTTDGLAAAAGGANATPTIGGPKPQWLSNLHSPIVPIDKMGAGPLVAPSNNDAVGPLAVKGPSKPGAQPTQRAIPTDLANQSASVFPGGVSLPKPEAERFQRPPAAAPATGTQPQPKQSPLTSSWMTAPPKQPSLLPPPVDVSRPELPQGMDFINKEVTPQGNVYRLPGSDTPVSEADLQAGNFKVKGWPNVPLTPEQTAALNYPTKNPYRPEHPFSATSRFMEELKAKAPGAYEKLNETARTPQAPHQMGMQSDDMSLAMLTGLPGLARAAPAAAAGRAAPAAAQTAARTAPVAAKGAPAVAEAAPAAAEASAPYWSRLFAPRPVSGASTLRNVAGHAVDPLKIPGTLLGMAGRSQNLPGWAQGTLNLGSRVSDALTVPVSSLLGLRQLRLGAQGAGGVEAAKDLALRGGMSMAAGDGLTGSMLRPATNLLTGYSVAKNLAQGDTEGAKSNLATFASPVTGGLVENTIKPTDRNLGLAIQQQDPLGLARNTYNQLADNVTRSAKNFDSVATTYNQQSKENPGMTNVPSALMGAIGNGQLQGKPEAKPTTPSPAFSDYAMNTLTGKPLPTPEEQQQQALQVDAGKAQKNLMQQATVPVPGQPEVSPAAADPVRQFHAQAEQTVAEFDRALASGDLAKTEQITQQHLQQAQGDPNRVMISMMAPLGPSNFNMPEAEYKQMLDGTPAPGETPLSQRFAMSQQKLTELESKLDQGTLNDSERTQLHQARQQFAELNRVVQGRLVNNYEQKVLAPMQKQAPELASRLASYRQKVESGQPLTPDEMRQMQVDATQGRQLVSDTAQHALRKAQLEFGRKASPNPAAGNADLSTIADFNRHLNETTTTQTPDGQVVTQKAHPLGQILESKVSQELKQSGVENPESMSKTLLDQLGDLPKWLLYGGLALTAVGGLGSAFGLFDSAPIMMLLGAGLGLTGLAGGDPSKLLDKSFWKGIPGQLSGIAQGLSNKAVAGTNYVTAQAPQLLQKGKTTLTNMMPSFKAKNDAVQSGTSGSLSEFFKKNQIALDKDGIPQLPEEPGKLRALVSGMSPQLKQEAYNTLTQKVQAKVQSIPFMGDKGRDPQTAWKVIENAAEGGNADAIKALEVRNALTKQGGLISRLGDLELESRLKRALNGRSG